MTAVRTIIHAGLPKTGTTTLQQAVFAKSEQLEYLGPPYRDKLGHGYLKQLFAEPRENRVDYQAVRRHMETYRARARDKNCPFLISDEAIGNTTKVERSKKLARFTGAFGQCEWIFVIRRPLDMLVSHYLWEMRCIEFNTGRYFMPFDQWFRNRWRRFSRNHISVISVGEVLEQATVTLGRDRLHVLPFEWLKSDPDRFSRTVAQVTDLDAALVSEQLKHHRRNLRLSELEFEFVSLLTRRNFRDLKRLKADVEAFLSSRSIVIDPRLVEAIGDEDSRPNRKAIFRIFAEIKSEDPSPTAKSIAVPDRIQNTVLERIAPALKRTAENHSIDLESLGYFEGFRRRRSFLSTIFGR